MATAPPKVDRRPARGSVFLPRPRRYQLAVLRSAARFKVLVAGRRWGKSIGVGLVAALDGHGPGKALKGALHGGQVWWVVPEYPITGRSRWRQLKRACRHAWIEKVEAERRLAFPGGGSITLKSADDPDSLRGEGLDGVVVDEASLVDADAWTEALRPTLSDTGGWALFLLTSKGRRNWCWGLFLRGASPELAEANHAGESYPGAPRPGWESFQRHTREAVEEGYMPQSELDDALADLGSTKFAQEYGAEFVVTAGGIIKPEWFRYYDQEGPWLVLEGDTLRRVPVGSLRRRATVDPAVSTKTTADYTAALTYAVSEAGDLIVLDLEHDRMEGPDLVPMLRRIFHAHRLTRIGFEAVAFQLAIVQEAARAGLPVVSLTPDKDKIARAELLAARLEGGRVFFPRNHPKLATMLDELTNLGTGEGHDDIVDVLAYAAHDTAVHGGGSGVESSAS